jgi:hypothetical protein
MLHQKIKMNGTFFPVRFFLTFPSGKDPSPALPLEGREALCHINYETPVSINRLIYKKI